MPSARPTSLQQITIGRRGRTLSLDDRAYRVGLWFLLGAGLVLRLLFTAKTAGNRFDLASVSLVAQALVHHPGHVYEIVNLPGQTPRWPYLPGYFPVILVVKGLGGLFGIAFQRLFRVPSSLADLAIAWLIQDYLAAKGAKPATRLAAVSLVMLGPSFFAISSIHGQIDAPAILPAVAALSVWERDRPKRRAWVAGLLIGLGVAVKTTPGLMLFALLPSARSRGEAARLIAATAVFPLLSALPIVAAAGTGWLSIVGNYHGGVGLGGLSLVGQPDVPLGWFHVGSVALSSVSLWFIHHGDVVAIAGVVVTALLLLRFRVPAPLAAVAVWLSVYVFGVDFFMQYMVWGLPFFLMAGYTRAVLILELLLAGPVFVIYHGVGQAWLVCVLYIAPMLIVWAMMTLSLGLLARRAANHSLAYSST
jgi:uncharacterized membrane protein